MPAKRSFTVDNWTPANVADTTTMANAGFCSLGATGAAAGLLVNEVRISGLAVASTVNRIIQARDSTLGATATALASPNGDGPLNGFSSAVVQISAVQFTTNPQRASAITSAREVLAFNSFGGIHLDQYPTGGEWGILGVTVSISETSWTTNQAGAGAMSSTIKYEPL